MSAPLPFNAVPGGTSAYRWAVGIGAITALSLLAGCSLRSPIRRAPESAMAVESSAFRQAAGSLLGASWQEGNRVVTLENGQEIFPAMLAAIRGARETINFETYVYGRGRIPEAFAEALAERARAGVSVKLILDDIGAGKAKVYHKQLREAGVQLEVFHPVSWLNVRRANFRTHRKLLVIDGRIGFTGGVGIEDEWDGNAASPKQWRELHYRIDGPAVAQLQAAFAVTWLELTGEILQGPRYFPALAPAGGVTALAFSSAPRSGRSRIELMYHLAIASARRTLLIENAYFLPDRLLLDALTAAARRGVRVIVLMPGELTDSHAVRQASRKRWQALRAAGVQLHEYQGSMLHAKLLIVDGLFVSVGSANFDPRSLRINDEANLNVLDRAFARQQTGIFLRDLSRSKPADIERSALERLPELPLQAIMAPIEGQL